MLGEVEGKEYLSEQTVNSTRHVVGILLKESS